MESFVLATLIFSAAAARATSSLGINTGELQGGNAPIIAAGCKFLGRLYIAFSINYRM